jgi:transposase InsO family protein
MGECGNPYDNAIAERVNGILKTEFLLDGTFTDLLSAQRAIREAITTYNDLRPHLSLDYLTPSMKYAA